MMSDFQKKAQEIIFDYCEGINYLEFELIDMPDMLKRLEDLARNEFAMRC